MKPTQIKDILKSVVKEIEQKIRLGEKDLSDVWKQVVGEKVVRHTKPVSFKNEILFVNVDSSTWLYQLTLFKQEYLDKIKNKVGQKNNLKDIRFRVGKI